MKKSLRHIRRLEEKSMSPHPKKIKLKKKPNTPYFTTHYEMYN